MFLSAIVAVCLASEAPDFEPLWRTGGLDNPESVIADGSGGFIVSNVNGEAGEADGNGYLSRLDSEGAIVPPQRWVEDLNAPKGLARLGDRLYVTDIDTLVAIDAESGEILERHAVEGAQFLNDAAAHDGGVLVSDSATGRIYRLEGGTVSPWLEDPALAGINGLWPEAGRLLVTTMTRGEVLAVDWESGALTVLVDGLPNSDGIARTADGGYVLSQWPGDVWYWREGEAPRRIFARQDPPVLMNDLAIVEDVVIIPHYAPGAVSAWRMRCRETGRLSPK